MEFKLMSVNNLFGSLVLNRILLIFVFAMVTSCSEQNGNQKNCPITVDSVSIIDSMKLEGTTYYLVHRVSGWSDKTEIFELYNIEPIFDHCAESEMEPVFGDSLEMTKTISHVFLNANNKSLDIVYKDGKPDKTHNTNLKLELR